MSKGFTLIELLVVLAIIGVLMTIAFTSQSTFNKTFILNNTAYDIALTIHSAESYGLGSRASGGITSAGYGVHFQNSPAGSFILFADTHPFASCSTPDCKSGDGVYTSSDTLVQKYTFGNNIVINNFCARVSSVWKCASDGSITSLDIVFARPNPNAVINAYNSSTYSPATAACIAIASPQGGAKFISVASSGEITASAASCP